MIHNIAKRQERIQFRWPEKDDDNLFLFFFAVRSKTLGVSQNPLWLVIIIFTCLQINIV